MRGSLLLKNKNHSRWLWILGWILVFPIPLSFLLRRNEKLSMGVKLGIITLASLFYAVFARSVSKAIDERRAANKEVSTVAEDDAGNDSENSGQKQTGEASDDSDAANGKSDSNSAEADADTSSNQKNTTEKNNEDKGSSDTTVSQQIIASALSDLQKSASEFTYASVASDFVYVNSPVIEVNGGKPFFMKNDSYENLSEAYFAVYDSDTQTSKAENGVSDKNASEASTGEKSSDEQTEKSEISSEDSSGTNQNTEKEKSDEIVSQDLILLSELDSLGRTGIAVSVIGKETLPTEERGQIGDIRPSGWHTVKYDCIPDMYLYNRCHLLGYQLTGLNAEPKNLITGTRYMNVQGMEPYETMTADFVANTGMHVLYRVTPIYEGNELLARGVLMEAVSLEDSGKGLCFAVYCFNVQPGIAIDYATGESSEADDPGNRNGESSENGNSDVRENTSDDSGSGERTAGDFENGDRSGKDQSQGSENNQTTEANTSDRQEQDYVLNTNTHKFHHTWCSSVDDMKEKNKRAFHGTRDEVIGMGYEPCKRCNP